MRMSARMRGALNDQIGMEAYASSYYMAMASWCEAAGYEGSAGHLYLQSDEERLHMKKIVQHLNAVGAGAEVPAVKRPPQSFRGLEAVFKAALKSEQAVTASFNRLSDMAQKEGDHPTLVFLQWFVAEQVEEERKMEAILQKFDVLGRDKIAVYEVDRAVGAMAPSAGAPAQ